MTRTSIVILLGVLAGGCKGETVIKDREETLRDLDVMKKTVEEKNKLIAALQEEAARNKGGQCEVVVAIEGNALTVKGGAGGGGGGAAPPVDTKAAAAGTKEFLDVVAKSRGAIQKCYEQALKKNSAIQGRTITLTVNATFSNQGAYQTSTHSATAPLGELFDTCFKQVASKWQLPTNSPAMTFKAQVSLTPS
jgi:hypothetical protein